MEDRWGGHAAIIAPRPPADHAEDGAGAAEPRTMTDRTDRTDRNTPTLEPEPKPGAIRRLLPEGSLARDVADRLAPRGSALDTHLIPLVLFGLAWLVYARIHHARPTNLDYFVPLADAFLHGRLGVTEAPSWLNELVPGGGGLFYVVYPPVPAILLVPIVWLFGSGFEQAWASILLGAASAALMSMVIAGMGVARWNRIVLSVVFAFGTIVWYSAQAGSSWHFAHVVAMFFTLLAIRACQLDARTALIGLLFSGAVLSRLPLVLATPFFLAYLADRTIREATDDRTSFGSLGAETPPAWRARFDLRRYLELALPIGVSLGIPLAGYLVYNRLRFGSIFENGYALIPGLLQENQYKHGFFSTFNIPRKLYALFLAVPTQFPEFPWIQSRHLGGLSIILTSPIFLWAIKARRPDWFGIGAWVSVGLILVPILLHADPGGAQFGFRYAQDFYPFIFLLTIRGLAGRIGFEAWLAIGIGVLVNVWGMGSTYFDWWA